MRRRLLLLAVLVCFLSDGESLPQTGVPAQGLENGTSWLRSDASCPKKSQYRPHGKPYCCEKCHRGHYKIADCTIEHNHANCVECREGTFLEFENFLRKCRSCNVCDTAKFHQIEVEKCTIYSNTVCRCPAGMYEKDIDGSTFNCRNCTSCTIGVRTECSQKSDTICDCQQGHYYHSLDKKCKPCQSCEDGAQCTQSCQRLTTGGLEDMAVLSVAIVSCTVLTVMVAIVTGYWSFRKCKRPAMTEYHNETGKGSESKAPICNSETLLPIQEVSASPETTIYSTAITDLPDCVRVAGASQLPNNSQVNYTIADVVPLVRWKEFVRRLGMSDRDIERAEVDYHRSYREAQYEMVKLWRDKQGGKGATIEAICKILKDMDLNGCAERFLEALQ